MNGRVQVPAPGEVTELAATPFESRNLTVAVPISPIL